MTRVRLADGKAWVDDQPISLLSGEVHYWRLNPNQWRPILRRVRELGLGVVATYVCWDYHELNRGEFDFTGHTDPRRNLLAFLELLAEEEVVAAAPLDLDVERALPAVAAVARLFSISTPTK